ncbi:hypothetical protein [Methylobacterium sp. J-076]|uniref:hypothetical protein n=1 Tax=Methylobacterium sp. J-076 TaxID=2836655 RepID=UPI001FBB3C85|nr:hypothetical protein [Methylobacterium sp. J-076]MCJ2015475.1 hypothetical protein [Methylobacterium sp. J-076]
MAEINVTVAMRERTMEPAQLLMTPAMRKELQSLTPIERSGGSDLPKVTKRFGQEEWAAVCERIQDAAEYIQEIEASRHQQEMQAQKIFANMQDEIASANARALAAERMLQDVQQRATNVVKTLEDKLQAAEDRARESEDWLTRISEAVRSNLNFP